MDLEFSDDEAELAATVADVLAGISPPSVVRAVVEGKGDGAEVWRQMVELDWPGLAIAPEHGGVGLGYLELAIVVDRLGWAATPGPFLATTTQFAPALRELGGGAGAPFLARVAGGELTGSLALAEGGRWTAAAVRTAARPDGDAWRLDGRKEAVVGGAGVDELVVLARGADGLGAFVVPTSAVEVVERELLDPTLPIVDVVLDGVVVGADRVLAEPGPDVEAALVRATEEATVAMAVATIGACRRLFEDTLAYAKEREQYQRPIGSFQALKHRLADMYLAVERASSLGWFAALTIAEEDPRRHEATALAKAAAGDCQRLVVGEALQMHGGIGLTWEHDLHFWLKRAKVGDALFGNAVAHRAALAVALGLVDTEAVA